MSEIAVDDLAEDAAATCLPWHDGLWRPMTAALAEDRVAHGLLFCGARGIGKRRFAARTAAALLCRARRPDGDACGECTGCRQRRAATHPDISRLVPEEAGKRIKVEQVRRFAHALHLTPQYDTGRIGWIDPADALTVSAANSLLKTLEEPPARCHILLITDRLSALLPTIRSRCQQWRVPAADPDTARDWLGRLDIATDALSADRLGAPLAMQAAHDSGLAEQITQWDADLTRLLARRANPVSVAERAAAAERTAWVAWLYRRTTDLLAICLRVDADSAAVDEAMIKAVQPIGAQRLQAWSRRVASVAASDQTNADWRLMLESLFIDLSEHVAEARQS